MKEGGTTKPAVFRFFVVWLTDDWCFSVLAVILALNGLQGDMGDGYFIFCCCFLFFPLSREFTRCLCLETRIVP